MAGSCGGACWLGSVYRPKGTDPASGAWWLRMRMGLIEHAAAPLGLLLSLSAGPGADTPVPVPCPSPICPGMVTGPRSPTCQNRGAHPSPSPTFQNRGRSESPPGRAVPVPICLPGTGTLPRPRFPWGSAPWAQGPGQVEAEVTVADFA